MKQGKFLICLELTLPSVQVELMRFAFTKTNLCFYDDFLRSLHFIEKFGTRPTVKI